MRRVSLLPIAVAAFAALTVGCEDEAKPPKVPERDEIYQGGSTGQSVQSELGPVEFAFHSMVDLSRYADSSFDMVYSGQSIEHVSEEDGDSVVREAFRV